MKAVSLSVVFYCIVNWIHTAREWKNYTRGFAACLCWFDGRAKLQQPRQPQQSKDKEWSRAKAQVLHTIKWQSVVLRPNKLFIGNARFISHENLAKVISPATNAHYIKYIYIQINISFLAAILLSESLLTMKLFCLTLPSLKLLCEAKELHLEHLALKPSHVPPSRANTCTSSTRVSLLLLGAC